MNLHELAVETAEKQAASEAEAFEQAFRAGLTARKKCALCDTEEDLLIHHKDANYKNNDINNLQCLCRSCHTIVHNKLRAEMRRISDENTD